MIETDSLLIKNILEEIWEQPWNIVNRAEEIKTLMARGVFQVVHVLREGNKLADYLANLTIEHHAMVHVNSFVKIDIQGRKILNNDKLQIPYIRVRTTKAKSSMMSKRDDMKMM